MNQPIIFIVCYDAYCGWCYGFSKVMIQIEKEYNNKLNLKFYQEAWYLADNQVYPGNGLLYQQRI